MYSLLIVDDEPIITDGLVELFRGTEDLELDIYSAYSAIEALYYLNKVKIDIILTDICMPDIDGIELHEEVIRHWPRCRVIFLTGYSDFEYIKSAIRNDSMDYLLKTEGDEAIIKAVQKAINSIDNEMKNENLIAKAKEGMERALPILQKEFMLDILQGAKIPLEERYEHFNYLQLELLPSEPVLLLLGRCDNLRSGIAISEKNRILYGIQNIVKEYLDISTYIVSCYYEGTTILWFIQPNELIQQSGLAGDAWLRTISFVQGTLDIIQDKCKELMNISLSFVVDSKPVEWEDIYENFIRMKLMLNRGFGLEQEILLLDSQTQSRGNGDISDSYADRQGLQVDMQLQKMGLLRNFIEAGEKDRFLETYDEMINSISEIKCGNKGIVMEAYYSLVSFFLPYMNRWNLWERIAYDLDIDKLTRMETHVTCDDIAAYFRKLALLIFKYRSYNQMSSTNRVIIYINNYIEENIGGDLSLIHLSELVHFNPVYLSRLYKKVTGKTLSEYIMEVKLNKAIEMLNQDGMKIHEIATTLGFKTPSYFTRFFKNTMGTTPQEYRDSLPVT